MNNNEKSKRVKQEEEVMEKEEESGEDEEHNSLQFGKGWWRWRWQEGGRGEEPLTCSGGGVDRQPSVMKRSGLAGSWKVWGRTENLLSIYTLSPPSHTHSERVCVCVSVCVNTPFTSDWLLTALSKTNRA